MVNDFFKRKLLNIISEVEDFIKTSYIHIHKRKDKLYEMYLFRKWGVEEIINRSKEEDDI